MSERVLEERVSPGPASHGSAGAASHGASIGLNGLNGLTKRYPGSARPSVDNVTVTPPPSPARTVTPDATPRDALEAVLTAGSGRVVVTGRRGEYTGVVDMETLLNSVHALLEADRLEGA